MNRPTAGCTVVIPCFNGASVLERAFESVMAQTFRDYHLVMVDDCSRDETPAIAKRLAAGHENVSVVSLEENGGQSRARNRGVQATRGPFVAFLDQDDTYHRSYLAHAMAVFESHRDRVDAVRVQPEISVAVHPEQHRMIGRSLGTTLVMRRQAFEFVGGWPESAVFREHPGGCEDIAFNMLFATLFQVAELDMRLYNYNHRPGNALDQFLRRTEVVDGRVRFLGSQEDDAKVLAEIARLVEELKSRARLHLNQTRR